MLSFGMALVMLVTSMSTNLSWASSINKNATDLSADFNVEEDCPDGQCVEEMIGLVEAKTSQARMDKCLPPEGTKDENAWFEENSLSIECFKLIKEIEEYYDRLEKIQAHFSGVLVDNEEMACKEDQQTDSLNLENLKDIAEVNEAASCSEERKKEIWDKCAADAGCVMVSSALTVSGPFAKHFIPKAMADKGCSATNDNCLKQLALGFVKAVFSFFEGAWGLLKMAGKGIGKAGQNFWNWVSGAEKHSSTSQLAAAQASEEEGFFKQLKNDFAGTMSKVWTGLMAAIKHWLANSMFCQEWSGVAQFSECKRPAQGLDCTECKAMITGMCAITGVLVAEIIPAFLTGGLVTVAKHGVSAASKVSKLFKISAASSRAIKNSRLGTMALKPVAAITKAVVKSRFTQKTLRAIETVAKSLNRFLLKPSVLGIKKSFQVMRSVARTSKTYLMLTPAGPVITFGSKAASYGFKAILFPFENALTVKSFQLGERMFEKIFTKVGSARFFGGVRPVLAGEAARAMSAIDDTYIEMQVTKWTKRYGSEFNNQAEAKYLKQIKASRPNVVDEYLAKRPQVKLEKLIDDLYPELNYGKYGDLVKTPDVIKAETDLLEAIGKMPDAGEKERLFKAYELHLSSNARADGLIDKLTFNRPTVLRNAQLDDTQRIEKAFNLTNIDRKKMPPEQAEKLRLSILKAHNHGSDGVYNYSFSEVREKYRILTEAGFTNRQAEVLIRSGLAGKPHPQDVLENLSRVAIPEVTNELAETMMKNPSYTEILKNLEKSHRVSLSRALKVLEDGGMSPAQAAATFRRHEGHFLKVIQKTSPNSNAEGLLATFISRQKKAGITDDIIKNKLDETLGKCK
jgi:hypothetical protein